MRLGFSSSRAIGLGIALLLGAAPTARGQQQEPRRTTSTRRIPVKKDRPALPASTPAPVATTRVNQDSIARAHNRTRPNEGLRMARPHNGGFYIGVAGGSTMPMGELKDNVNNSYLMGWNVTVPFGWDFSGFPLGLRFDLAMDNLRANGNFVDLSANPVQGRNVAIFSGSGGLKLNVPLGRTASRFYLLGGAGAHRITGYATSAVGSDSAQTIKDAKTNVGWYGGAGLNFRFGRTALFIESRYINVNAKQPVGFAYEKATYIPIILGFQF